VTGKIAWEPLGDEELAEMAGDGTCTHLPYVRMALELQGQRAALAELRRLLAKMPGGAAELVEDPAMEAPSSRSQLRCGWCFVALGSSREAVEAHLVECRRNPLVMRVEALTRELRSRGDLEHSWKLVSPAEEGDPTESETHRCEACGLQRLSEWGTLPTFYREISARWARVEEGSCRPHSVGARYQAASDAGEGCAHPALKLCGRDDCWAIACTRCGKRWCNEALSREALRSLVPEGAPESPVCR
jgi:hypothetical protein